MKSLIQYIFDWGVSAETWHKVFLPVLRSRLKLAVCLIFFPLSYILPQILSSWTQNPPILNQAEIGHNFKKKKLSFIQMISHNALLV